MALMQPVHDDSKYNLLFKAAQNTYELCVTDGKSGMQAPIHGDYEYSLCWKIALNTYILAS